MCVYNLAPMEKNFLYRCKHVLKIKFNIKVSAVLRICFSIFTVFIFFSQARVCRIIPNLRIKILSTPIIFKGSGYLKNLLAMFSFSLPCSHSQNLVLKYPHIEQHLLSKFFLNIFLGFLHHHIIFKFPCSPFTKTSSIKHV